MTLRARRRVGSWRWGVACCALLTVAGCAHPETVAHIWDIPPGVPVETGPEESVPLPPSDAPLASTHESAPKSRLWGAQTLISSTITTIKKVPFSTRRPNFEDPFLLMPPTEGPGGTRTMIASTNPRSTTPSAGSIGQGITSERPEPRHETNDGGPKLGEPSQEQRLLAAIQADRVQAAKAADAVAVREAVEHLMTQARADLDQGRIAAAYKSAQAAEAMASDKGIVFEDGQQPADLVRLLKAKVLDDIGTTPQVPPEQSVAEGDAAPPKLEFGPELEPGNKLQLTQSTPGVGPSSRGKSAGPILAPEESDNPYRDLRKPAQPKRPEPSKVEFLPPSPEPEQVEVLPAPGPALASPEIRRPVLNHPPIEIVGPSMAVDSGPENRRVEAAPTMVAMNDGGPQNFWPERSDNARHSASGDSESNVDEPHPARQVVSKNIQWSDTPEPVTRAMVQSVPRPLFAVIGVVVAWLGLFVVSRIRGAMNSKRLQRSRS